MKIQEIYKENKNNLLFSESKKFLELRDDLSNSFDISPIIKKNNESLKHLDPNVLDFFYRYENKSDNFSYLDNKKDTKNLEIVNGKIISIKTNNINNIKINNIDNANDVVQRNFLDSQKYFSKDYVFNLNSLMLNSGYEINVGENQEVDFFISNSITEDNFTIFQKNLINCSKNSKIIIIEEYNTAHESNNNNVSLINIEEGSEVIHLIFQKNSAKAHMQSTSYANCHKESKYKQLVVNLSEGSSRNHHYANLIGQEATASLDGIFFAAKKQFVDNKTQINHNLPNCTSSQRYKGVLTDHSKASYLSKTFVDKIAQKTEAYQLSKGILLSEDSYFHSKPELKIFADDVKCSHGSTIGPIDRDLLFYLRSRGLDKRSSTSLLIKSFFHDIIQDVHDTIFIDKFNLYSNIWLKKNNL